MPFSNVPTSMDARETMRQRLRAGLEAAAVLVTSLAGVLVAALRPGTGTTELVSLGCIAVCAVVIAVLVYKGRASAYLTTFILGQQNQRLKAVVEGTGVALWESLLGRNCIYVSE